jgi:L-threonylcarbamoyladenylate synthase
MSSADPRQLVAEAARAVRNGGVVAYPTEAVYGLGCDPRSEAGVRRILALKRRPPEMGVILIASRFEQLAPYIQTLDAGTLARLRASWPGPVTWLVPARPEVPAYLRGSHDTLAVRVTAHPVAAALCELSDMAIVSTSANHSGEPPARTAESVRRLFADAPEGIDCIVPGDTGVGRPTEIRDARTGEVIRPG